MSRHSGPIVKQQQKLAGCKKRLDWTLVVGTSPYKWQGLHEHCICTGENGLASTQLSVNMIYLAKLMQMLFVGIQCSDQPRDKT